MRHRRHLFAAGLALAAALPLEARAQNPVSFEVCPSQQKLEQYLGSGGRYIPEGCRVFTVTAVQGSNGPVCVIDLNPGKQGVLGAIVDATMPTQWWAACGAVRGP